jgi:hypothetical protein
VQTPNSFLRKNAIYIALSLFVAATDTGFLYQSSMGWYTQGTNLGVSAILGVGTLIYVLIIWKMPKNKKPAI